MNEKDKLNLIQYIKTERAKGVPKTQIEETLLLEGGWTHDDLTQVFSAIDAANQSASDQTLSVDPKTKTVTGKHKLWYLLILITTFFVIVFAEAFAVFGTFISSDLAGAPSLLFFELVFITANFLIIRGIARSSARHNSWKILLRILLFLMLNIGLWAMVAILNHPVDGGGTHESYKLSNLPNIITTADQDFTLMQGQTAEITDISATLRYTGYTFGGPGGDDAEYDLQLLPGGSINSFESLFNNYNIIEVSNEPFDKDVTHVTFRVETAEKTCEKAEAGDRDDCWGDLAGRKRDIQYCLMMSDTTRHSGCINWVARKALDSNEEEKARGMCKSDTSSEFNLCKVIGVDSFMSLGACFDAYNAMSLTGTETYQPILYCMSHAKDTNTGDPEACQKLRESDQKEICKNMFDPSSPYYYESD